MSKVKLTHDQKELQTLVSNQIGEFDVKNEFFQSEMEQGGCWQDGPAGDFDNACALNNISYKDKDSFGGEGQGDQYWSVYEFTKGDASVFVKFYGSYQSYNGSEYDDYCFVVPFEKTVVDYKQV